MAKERLIGSDGKLVVVTYDDAVSGNVGGDDLDTLQGDGTAGTGAGWYEVVSVSDDTSALDSNLSVGDLFWDDGSTVLDIGSDTPDSVKFLIETEKADIQSFSFEFSRAEIDVTTLSDDTKRYRSGKTDMSGSFEGLTTLGVTDTDGYITDSFIRIISQASDGSVTVSSVNDDPIYIKGVVQGDTTSGETESFVWAKVVILSYTLNAGGEDAQSFSSSFRVAPGNPEPTFYKRAIA